MAIRYSVYCRTSFVAFHQWKDAPEQFKYLSSPHRHLFQVEVEVFTSDADRGMEFHELKLTVDAILKRRWGQPSPNTPITDSCENIAAMIAGLLHSNYGYTVLLVDVSEDGECGGRVHFV